MKISCTQRRLLAALKDGAALTEEFDVWGPKPNGTWLRVVHRDCVDNPLPATVSALVREGLIVKGELTRPYSGHRSTPYLLTDKGRAA